MKTPILLTRLSLCFAVMCLSACTTMRSTPEEIRSVTAKEGIVVGSFLVRAPDIAPEDDSWGPFRPVAKNMNYVFQFKPSEGLLKYTPLGESTLVVKANKEEYFVRKLAPGRYAFNNIKIGTALAPYRQRFTVEAGKVTYIGKFELQVSARVEPGTKFSTRRTNAIEAAREAIANDYPVAATNLVLANDYLAP